MYPKNKFSKVLTYHHFCQRISVKGIFSSHNFCWIYQKKLSDNTIIKGEKGREIQDRQVEKRDKKQERDKNHKRDKIDKKTGKINLQAQCAKI